MQLRRDRRGVEQVEVVEPGDDRAVRRREVERAARIRMAPERAVDRNEAVAERALRGPLRVGAAQRGEREVERRADAARHAAHAGVDDARERARARVRAAGRPNGATRRATVACSASTASVTPMTASIARRAQPASSGDSSFMPDHDTTGRNSGSTRSVPVAWRKRRLTVLCSLVA